MKVNKDNSLKTRNKILPETLFDFAIDLENEKINEPNEKTTIPKISHNSYLILPSVFKINERIN